MGTARDNVASLLTEAGKRFRRSKEEVETYVEPLLNNWFDSAELIADASTDDLASLGLPLRLAREVISVAAKTIDHNEKQSDRKSRTEAHSPKPIPRRTPVEKAANDALLKTIHVKRAPVSFNMKSRVLGKAGENLNFIREETGVGIQLHGDNTTAMQVEIVGKSASKVGSANELVMRLLKKIDKDLAQWKEIQRESADRDSNHDGGDNSGTLWFSERHHFSNDHRKSNSNGRDWNDWYREREHREDHDRRRDHGDRRDCDNDRIRDKREYREDIRIFDCDSAFNCKGAIIGTKGENIRYIQDCSGAKLDLQGNQAKGESLILHIRADSSQDVKKATGLSRQLIDKVHKEYNDWLSRKRDSPNTAPGEKKSDRKRLRPSAGDLVDGKDEGVDAAEKAIPRKRIGKSLLELNFMGFEHEPSPNLFISGVPSFIERRSIIEIFTKAGYTVQRAKLTPDDKQRGVTTAMVELASVEEATAAIEASAAIKEAIHSCEGVLQVRFMGDSREPKPNLYIAGLPSTITKNALTELFSNAGFTVQRAKINWHDGFRGAPNAWLELASAEEATAAIEAFDGQRISAPANATKGARRAAATPLELDFMGFDHLPSSNLYVSGLPSSIEKASVIEMFTKAGWKVQRAKVTTDSKGLGVTTAMVELASVEEATAAIDAFTGLRLDGVLRVRFMGDDQEPKPNLYIAGVPTTFDKAMLSELFNSAGFVVQRANVNPDFEGRGVTNAWVELASAEEASAAIDAFNGQSITAPANAATPAHHEADMDVEAFIAENGIDESAASDLRNCPIDVQQLVLEEGDLASAQNPSSRLIGRIKRARISLKRHDDADGGLESSMHGTLDIDPASVEEVDDFIASHSIEAHGVLKLQSLDPTLQRIVIDKGSLLDARDQTEVLMKRCSDASSMKPGDWICTICHDIQYVDIRYSRKDVCTSCNNEKEDDAVVMQPFAEGDLSRTIAFDTSCYESEFSAMERLLGGKGCNLKYIREETGARVYLRNEADGNAYFDIEADNEDSFEDAVSSVSDLISSVENQYNEWLEDRIVKGKGNENRTDAHCRVLTVFECADPVGFELRSKVVGKEREHFVHIEMETGAKLELLGRESAHEAMRLEIRADERAKLDSAADMARDLLSSIEQVYNRHKATGNSPRPRALPSKKANSGTHLLASHKRHSEHGTGDESSAKRRLSL